MAIQEIACASIFGLLAAAVASAANPDARALRVAADGSPQHEASGEVPPVGRSLFDFVVTRVEGGRGVQRVPFPFPALARQVGSHLEGGEATGVKQVLIPLGRSLQRQAAEDEPFKYPRVVLAVVGEPRDGSPLLLKDRLYLGYHEKAAILEVISYNEAAGRFEFQVVRDYREGGRRDVVYANRGMCVACHQNQAPIFSRATWDETDANLFLAARLKEARPDFYGLVPGRNVDIPNAIDDATERANLFSVAQTLWRSGCEVAGEPIASTRCRAGIFSAALKLRLSGDRYVRLSDATTKNLRISWRARWPTGLPIPNSDLPNRDPFAMVSETDRAKLDAARLRRAAEVHVAFDPLRVRDPVGVWHPDNMEHFVKVLSQFISPADARALDRHLRRTAEAGGDRRRVEQLSCAFGERRSDDGIVSSFDCTAEGGHITGLSGQLVRRGTRITEATLDRIGFAGGFSLTHVTPARASILRRGGADDIVLVLPTAPSLRSPDGDRLASVKFLRAGKAEATMIEDFARVERAIAELADENLAGTTDAFSAQAFRRVVVLKPLFAKLGMPARAWCCVAADGMPAAADGRNVLHGETIPETLLPFYRACARCHEAAERFPPGFLHGDTSRATKNIDGCAQRMLYRLAMWRVPEGERAKTPMPPPAAPYAKTFAGTAEFGAMREYLMQRLAETQRGIGEREVLSRRYEELPRCAPIFE